LYDFIRMLDAEGYPKAFIKLNDVKIEFSEVHLKNRKLIGRFEIKEVKEND
jgi:methionyl-tRNA formyltransferase